jgi:hypothetical protein
MSIFIMNLLFAIDKRISFSALSSKTNRRCGSNKTFLLTTRQFFCAPNVRSVKRDVARTRKKSGNSNLVHNLRSEFDPHRHLRRKASVRKYNAAGIISPNFIRGQIRSSRVVRASDSQCRSRHSGI